MPNAPNDPFEAGLRIAQALEVYSISYALGGALAYGIWGIPRATIDVDVNVFVKDTELPDVFRALESLGIELDRKTAEQEHKARGMFVGRWGMYRIDVFTPSISFAWEAERTRVGKRVEGQNVYFLSAEALAVFKLLFFRNKDLVDLERLVAVQGERLDAAYVRRHIVSMMGEQDERVLRWDGLTRAAG